MTCVPAEREDSGLGENSSRIGRPIRDRARRALRRTGGTAVVAVVAGTVALGLIAFVVWSLYRFGSISLGRAYLEGYSVYPETSTVSAGDVTAGSEAVARFRLRNLASTAVRVVGAKTSCGCIAFEDLPMTIPPGAVGEMTLRFKACEQEAGRLIEHRALLYLDVSRRRVFLRAQANVLPPNGGAG